MPKTESLKEHLADLIAEAHPDDSIDQPRRYYVEVAEEEFEAEGFDLDPVPWNAIAMRAHERRVEDES